MSPLIILSAVLATGSPAATPALETQCLAEARWPAAASHAWHDGSVTRRQQLGHAYNLDVATGQNLCRRLASGAAGSGEADSFLSTQAQRYGDEATGHIGRLGRLYKALASPAA